jgi:hypothetical protein
MTETVFEVKGPFEVPICRPPGGGRLIGKAQASQFWQSIASKYPDIHKSRGCYIFAIRNGRGSKPGYVGKTIKKTFSFETFNVAKLQAFNEVLSLYKKGTPVLYFVLTKNGKGIAGHIDHLETFLIQNAAAVNPYHLQNIQLSGLGWQIAGVLRGGGGQPTVSAQELKKLLKLAHPPKSQHRDTDATESQLKTAKPRAAKPKAKTRAAQPRKTKSKSSVKAARPRSTKTQ